MDYILRTFELAKKGLGTTWPNPLVGCVIMKDGRVIAEGFHRKAGEVHAELDAINNSKESIKGSTVYVNLEPCCHTNKRTPPCAQRLIQEGVAKVVISNLDPHPEVNGKGVELLRAAGIEVEHGVHAAIGEELNEVFFTSQRTKLPFVHLKMASTLDGKISMPNGESQWITGESARNEVHRMRAQSQAVMVGAGTLRADNPKLNVRLENFSSDQPFRIVFTNSGELPYDRLLFTDELREKTLVFTRNKINLDLPASQITQVNSLREAIENLFEKKIINLLLEGGPSLAGEMIKEGLIHRVSLFMNPSFLGEGPSSIGPFGLTKLNERPKLKNVQTKTFGDDLMITGRI
ncbi:MAG: bifunctional diaminohydroxyphosphoribosylaminopyrimidine deaminase/5-amino-6-(5-phosphoribosylamino)uracil reductase RibD [Bacteriovoracaceae bacterium]